MSNFFDKHWDKIKSEPNPIDRRLKKLADDLNQNPKLNNKLSALVETTLTVDIRMISEFRISIKDKPNTARTVFTISYGARPNDPYPAILRINLASTTFIIYNEAELEGKLDFIFDSGPIADIIGALLYL